MADRAEMERTTRTRVFADRSRAARRPRQGWRATVVGAGLALALVAGCASDHGGPRNLPATTGSATATEPAIFDWPQTGAISQQALRHFDDYINADIAKGVIPGGVLLVVRDGKTVYQKTYGYRDPATRVAMTDDTLFRIYSMTKPITSAAVMMLVEEGKVALQDPVAKYLPEFKDVKVGVEKKGSSDRGTASQATLDLVAPIAPMTVQDLLRHTAGLTYGFFGDGLVKKRYLEQNLMATDIDNKAFSEKLAKLPLIYQPGTTWEYSHATDVLGRLIEVASGKTLYTFLKERLFDPLGMKDTSFDVSDAPRQPRIAEPYPTDRSFGPGADFFDPRVKAVWESGGGGLMSTASDYMRFALMLLNGGTLDGKRYLSPKSIQAMASNQIAPSAAPTPGPYYIPGPGYGFGLGLAVRTEPGAAPFLGSVGELNWNGAGGTSFWVDPAERLAVVYLMQAPSHRGRYRVALRNTIYGAFEGR